MAQVYETLNRKARIYDNFGAGDHHVIHLSAPGTRWGYVSLNARGGTLAACIKRANKEARQK